MFKSIYKVGVMATLLAFVISGCTYKNEITSTTVDGEVLKEYNKVQTTKQHLEIAEDKQKNVTTQETLEGTIASLATQMMRNKKMNTNKPVLITSFVRLDAFKKTSEKLTFTSFSNYISSNELNKGSHPSC